MRAEKNVQRSREGLQSRELVSTTMRALFSQFSDVPRTPKRSAEARGAATRVCGVQQLRNALLIVRAGLSRTQLIVQSSRRCSRKRCRQWLTVGCETFSR